MVNVPFCWVDVFAASPLTGNPLAIVPDADALSVDTMRAIAREFNQSETTFLVRPDRPGADYRLRSFTPGGDEVLGAGHNAIGAWAWLANSGRLDSKRKAFVQQIGDDILPVHVGMSPDGRPQISMAQSPVRFARRVEDRDNLAAVLGLHTADLSGDRVAEVVSTGAPHLLVPAQSSGAVDAAEPESSALRTLLASAGAEGCYLYAIGDDAPPDVDASARFFNPTVGIAEDPATGTAAGPLAVVLVRDGLARPGGRVVIEQGRRLGRPSRIELRVDGDTVTILGTGIVVAEGALRL